MGIPRVKMKIGRQPDEDLARVRAAREAIGPEADLFVDANGGYDRKQALEKAQAFHDLDVCWFEEPVSSDDLSGLRLLRDRAPAGMEIAAGEYSYDAWYFRRMLEAGAVDVLQADATRCRGISGLSPGGCPLRRLFPAAFRPYGTLGSCPCGLRGRATAESRILPRSCANRADVLRGSLEPKTRSPVPGSRPSRYGLGTKTSRRGALSDGLRERPGRKSSRECHAHACREAVREFPAGNDGNLPRRHGVHGDGKGRGNGFAAERVPSSGTFHPSFFCFLGALRISVVSLSWEANSRTASRLPWACLPENMDHGPRRERQGFGSVRRPQGLLTWRGIAGRCHRESPACALPGLAAARYGAGRPS